MVKYTDYPENFFRANEFLYGLLGLRFRNTPNEPKWRKYLRLSWTCLVYSIAGLFLLLELLILKDIAKDINKIFSHIGLLMSNSLGIFKLMLLLFQNNKITRIIDSLQVKDYRYEKLGEFDPALIFLKGKKFSQMCTTLIFSLYICVGISAHISTASQIHRNVEGNHFGEEYTCEEFLPYNFLIPFEVDTTLKCHYILIFMDCSVCVFATTVACYDSFFLTLLNYIKTHLIVLRGAFQSIRKRVLRRLELDINLQTFHDESIPIIEKELYQELTRLIRHLTVLLRVSKELEKMFNLMILAQTLTSLFNVASCLFNAAKVPVGSSEFLATLEYFVSMLLELALVCWFGGEITDASKEIMFALYDSDWLSSSRRFKKSLILTMCRMQKPIYLTIGKFFPLTLSATVSVCKASFSYYTVFKEE